MIGAKVHWKIEGDRNDWGILVQFVHSAAFGNKFADSEIHDVVGIVLRQDAFVRVPYKDLIFDGWGR